MSYEKQRFNTVNKMDGRIGDPVLLRGTQLLDVVARAIDGHEWHRYLLLEQRAISDTF